MNTKLIRGAIISASCFLTMIPACSETGNNDDDTLILGTALLVSQQQAQVTANSIDSQASAVSSTFGEKKIGKITNVFFIAF